MAFKVFACATLLKTTGAIVTSETIHQINIKVSEHKPGVPTTRASIAKSLLPTVLSSSHKNHVN